MDFPSFSNEDFDVFLIDGLEERMGAIKEKIRPKLESLGQHYALTLSALTGDEVFAHVAKHARRTKNPPNDTWVAFAQNPRGYKMLPHFQIGLWGTHLFIWFAVIYESPNKQEYGRIFEEHIDEIYEAIPVDFVWSIDHTKSTSIRHNQISKDKLASIFNKLQTIKKSEILCGVEIERRIAANMKPSELERLIDGVFAKLTPLYKILKINSGS